MKKVNVMMQTIVTSFVVVALLLVGCDSAVVDNDTSLSSSADIEMLLNGDTGDLGPVCEAALLDVSLVLDVSGSMYGAPLQAAKDGAKALVAELSDTDQGALVSFSTSATRNLDLTLMDASGQTAINTAIDGLTATGLTNIQAGIIFGAEELMNDESLFALVTNPSGNARAVATKIMVLLSDGQDPNPVAANAAATIAKNAGIRIFTIALGYADIAAMQGYASSPDDAYTSADLDDLTEVFSDIAAAICPEPVEIDIKPGSYPNSINLNNNGVISVAVFGTAEFDATTIDPETVRFGSLDYILLGNGAMLAHPAGHLEDVNLDGMVDFVGHFATQDTGFTSDDEYGWLIAETMLGESIAGFDEVRILDRGKPAP